MRAYYSKADSLAVLGLKPGCTLLDARDAYKLHALQLQSDRHSDVLSTPQQTELFQLLGTAYENAKNEIIDGARHKGAKAQEPVSRSTQRSHDPVAETKEKLRASRQKALQTKWTEEFQALVCSDALERRISEAVEAGDFTNQILETEARHRRIIRDARGKGKVPPDLPPVTDAPKLRRREKKSGKAAKGEKAKIHNTEHLQKKERLRKEALQELESGRRQETSEVTTDDIIMSGLGLPRRPEDMRSYDINSDDRVPREVRFECKTSDPLEDFNLPTYANGKRSMNVTMPTVDFVDGGKKMGKRAFKLSRSKHSTNADTPTVEARVDDESVADEWVDDKDIEDRSIEGGFEEDSHYWALMAQWESARVMKEAKLEYQASVAAQTREAEEVRTRDKRAKRIETLQEQLKAVGPLNGKPMDKLTVKAVLSGTGNAVDALPNDQKTKQHIWKQQQEHKALEIDEDEVVRTVNGRRVVTADVAALTLAEKEESRILWDSNGCGLSVAVEVNPLTALACLRAEEEYAAQLIWVEKEYQMLWDEGVVI
ncbi:hypothetical protein LTR85_000683 [Meristemomyces frigidus]|nr:hypothetical protein LTR85_000683 [Meristemomyces frigidus]